MVGFVVITHNDIGQEMLRTVQEIIKESPHIANISVPSENFLESQKKIANAIKGFPQANGVILLLDLFGATPCNLCKEFLDPGKVEMITGCNLPMLIKAATTDFKESPAQVAQFLKNYGKDNIRVYSTDF